MLATKFTFYLLLLMCALGTTHNAVYSQCILFVKEEMHPSIWQLKFTLTIYFFAILLCRCFLGKFSDKFGSRKCLIFAMWLGLSGHLIATISPNMPIFITGRFLIGLGLGGAQIMSLVILMQIFTAKKKSEIIANEQVFFALASIFLPLISNFFSKNYSWRLTFLSYFIFTLYTLTYFKSKNDAEKIDCTKCDTPQQSSLGLLKNSNFIVPVLISCLSISGFIIWSSYFSLIINAYNIDLTYLLAYQLIPIMPFLIVSTFYKKLTANKSEKSMYKNILLLQASALTAVAVLIFFDKTHNAFKFVLVLPAFMHSFAGALLRPLMQEKALSIVSASKIGFASSAISILQVSINAVFSVILNVSENFVFAFTSIEMLVFALITIFFLSQKLKKHYKNSF